MLRREKKVLPPSLSKEHCMLSITYFKRQGGGIEPWSSTAVEFPPAAEVDFLVHLQRHL